MPEKVHKNNLPDSVIKKIRELFSEEPEFSIQGYFYLFQHALFGIMVIMRDINIIYLNSVDRWDLQKLTVLVCRLYYMTLWLLPAFIRQWWKSLEHKDSVSVDKLTTKFVSPSLIMEEMKAIKKERPTDNFSVSIVLSNYCSVSVIQKNLQKLYSI